MRQVAAEHGGWVPLAHIAEFRQPLARGWGPDRLAVAAMEARAVVELSEDGTRVRPRGSGDAGAVAAAAAAAAVAAAPLPAPHDTVMIEAGGAADEDEAAAAAAEAVWDTRVLVAAPGARGGATDIRVLSFNVLAEHMARKDPLTRSDWRSRRRLTVRAILHHAPGLVCLQEVQTREHAGELLAALDAAGYDGAYNDEVPTKNTVLLAWRRGAFEVIETWNGVPLVEAAARALARRGEDAGGGSAADAHLRRAAASLPLAASFNAKLGKRRVIYARLRHVTSGRPLLLCSAHTNVPLEPAPLIGGGRGQPRDVMAEWLPLLDVQLFVAEADLAVRRFAQVGGDPPESVGVIMCLDANSLPGSAAALYLTGGGVPVGHPVHAQAVAAGLRAPVTGISHPLRLGSAYGGVLGREPSWTNMNYGSGFVGAIDVIATNLAPLAALDVPERPRWGLVVMPNAVMPSDHVPLEAVLACPPLGL